MQSQSIPARRKGGNRKPQTFRNCEYCGQLFGPLDNLKRRYCSRPCQYAARIAAPHKGRATATREARRAQRRIRWLVQSGKVTVPDYCEGCGKVVRLEAAHYDYAEPERVRWLCTSCHRRWDWAEPKHGTIQ